MTLAQIQSYYFRRTKTNATSFPAADQVIALNAAADRVHSKVRVYLDTFYPTAWTTTDLSTGTATPKFDSHFHELIPLYVCADFAIENDKHAANGFAQKIALLENQLDLFYAERNYRIATVTIASPGVFTCKDHGLQPRDTVVFTTSGALPTGLTAETVRYYVIDGTTDDTFQVSTSLAGTAVTTSGTQSGIHYFSSDRPKRLEVFIEDTQ